MLCHEFLCAHRLDTICGIDIFLPLIFFCRKQGQSLASPFLNHWRVTTLVCRWSTWSHLSVPSRYSLRSASATSKQLVSPVYPLTATTNNRLDHITHTDSMKIKRKAGACKKEEAFHSLLSWACYPECIYHHTLKYDKLLRNVLRYWFTNSCVLSK